MRILHNYIIKSRNSFFHECSAEVFSGRPNVYFHIAFCAISWNTIFNQIRNSRFWF